MDDIDHEMRFVNLLGKFGPLCGTRWGQAQLKLNLRDLLMQLSTLVVSAVVALESAPASATLKQAMQRRWRLRRLRRWRLRFQA